MTETNYFFSQLHVNVARNATDDFNLFHDSGKWRRINGNPFGGPIVLGFQLESLIEGRIAAFRHKHAEQQLIVEHGLNFSNYEFSFATAVKPGQAVAVEIKASKFKAGQSPTLSNRVIVKVDGGLALMGYKKETAIPLFLADADPVAPADLRGMPDRSFLPRSELFLKRKFMTTSNAKNFLCGSLRDQSEYFDELQDKVNFPEMFPCALLSSALLEKAIKRQHDFERNPMVYQSHKISVDRSCLARLKSSDALHILIKPSENSAGHDFGGVNNTPLEYECYGLVGSGNIVFRAVIALLPLALIINR
jgi:hypothetical protein